MLDPTLSDWLDRQADALDRGEGAAPPPPAPPAPPPPGRGRRADIKRLSVHDRLDMGRTTERVPG
ncbi:hypothetical protein FSB80_17625 [Pseudomonas aeruginosa]|nr:hypothetical protein FSB80_17625 [Pseudomonas aeruginosa]